MNTKINKEWLVCFGTVLILWLLLFWPLQWSAIPFGIVAAALIVIVLGKRFPKDAVKALDWRRWVALLQYIPFFAWYVLKANLDVAARVLHPDVPIRPGIVKVRTTLTTEMGKTALANSITLTPGTLTIDIDGQDFYVHWINISTDDVQQRTAEIVGRFEPLLRRIFE